MKSAAGNSIGQPLYEAAGLRWLEEGGARVPTVLVATSTRLETTRLASVAPSRKAAAEFGRMLARMHASGADHYGAPPGNYQGPAWMGQAPLPLVQEALPWGQFYSRFRIKPYMNDVFTDTEAQLIDALCSRLESGALDHREPALVQSEGRAASRIHGDLWNGNLMWTPKGCFLIDPAAAGGHAEEDLATLRTFGAPFIDEIISGYQEVSPLESGWQQRVGLHQMHILMVHCFLFGRSYVPSTLRAAREALEIA